MTDAIAKSPSFVKQISRPAQFKSILALVGQQQTFQLRQRLSKHRRQLRGRFWKTFKRDVQRDLCIRRVSESFNLQGFLRQSIRASKLLQLPKSFRQQGRQHRALVDRHNHRTLRQKISDGARIRITHRPLRAIPVSIRLRRMLLNRPAPLNSAQPRERLPQNLFLQPQLLRRRNMLVMAAAAGLKVRAARSFALRGSGRHLQQLRPHHLLALGLGSRAHFLPRQHVRHKNRVAVGVRQSVAAIHKLLNRYAYLFRHMWPYSAMIRAQRKAPASRKFKKSSRGSAAAVQTLPAGASACISSPPAPVAPLSFCAGKPTTVHRPRAGCAAANLPSRASSPALLSCRPAPSTAAPNPRNRASQENRIAVSCPAQTPQSPPAALPFPDSGLHLSLPKPQPEPRSLPYTPSTPRVEKAPSLRVHSSARCLPLPPAPLPLLAAPHRCSTPGSSTVFPLPAANARNFQTRDRFPSAPLPAARPPSATSP